LIRRLEKGDKQNAKPCHYSLAEHLHGIGRHPAQQSTTTIIEIGSFSHPNG